MIDWSNHAVKFTSGIGCLCTAGLLADISAKSIPAWLAVGVSILPVVVFLFFHPGEMPLRLVRVAQTLASVWYLALALVLTVLFFSTGTETRGWPIFFIGLLTGAVPCVIVLWRSRSTPQSK